VYCYSHFLPLIDIKPPNIGFDEDGTLKLFDFGLAKEDSPPERFSSIGSSGNSGPLAMHILMNKPTAADCVGNTGTTRYMAPEIILGEEYGTAVDIFAASIVCWEVMTLLKPYANDSSGQFVKQCVAVYDDRPTIPGPRNCSKLTVWPRALTRLVHQGWHKDPAARLTARQMRRGLEAIVDKKQQRVSTAPPVLSSVSTTSTASQPEQESAHARANEDEQSC
jgi:serine/threonine protein kinase